MRLRAFVLAALTTACSQSGSVLPSEYTERRAQVAEPTPYDRGDWKHWVDVETEGYPEWGKDCQDARHEVLVMHSTAPVTFATDRECRVATGSWTCPYSGAVVTNPSLIDIEHIVSLKDAHESGGHAWTPERRQEFANDPENLLATSRSANRSKGSRGPDEWLPPLESYRCTHIQAHVRIKAKYGLEMGPVEGALVGYMQVVCDAGLVPPRP